MQRPPDSYRLAAGPHVLDIPYDCVERGVGLPEPYRWTAKEKRFAEFYLWTSGPDMRCGGAGEQHIWASTPAGGASVSYHTTYYGEHAAEHLRMAFQLFVLEERLDTPSSCPPMYREDGSWRPREGDCSRFYRPDPSRFRRLGALADATHFEHVNPHFYARAPTANAAYDDVYAWGSLAEPDFLLKCDRRAPEPGMFVAGAGRVCVGAFAHDGFVTLMRFSQNYIPVDEAQNMRLRYVKLVSDMAVKQAPG